MVDYLEMRTVGKTSVKVNVLGLGTGALGFLYEPVTTEAAEQTIQAALDAGIRFFEYRSLVWIRIGGEKIGPHLVPSPARHVYAGDQSRVQGSGGAAFGSDRAGKGTTTTAMTELWVRLKTV